MTQRDVLKAPNRDSPTNPERGILKAPERNSSNVLRSKAIDGIQFVQQKISDDATFCCQRENQSQLIKLKKLDNITLKQFLALLNEMIQAVHVLKLQLYPHGSNLNSIFFLHQALICVNLYNITYYTDLRGERREYKGGSREDICVASPKPYSLTLLY